MINPEEELEGDSTKVEFLAAHNTREQEKNKRKMPQQKMCASRLWRLAADKEKRGVRRGRQTYPPKQKRSRPNGCEMVALL